MDGREWVDGTPVAGATVCTCIAHLQTSDGLGVWVVDVADPACPHPRHREVVS